MWGRNSVAEATCYALRAARLLRHGAEAHHSTWWRAGFQALRDNRRATPRTLRTAALRAVMHFFTERLRLQTLQFNSVCGSWALWAALGPSWAALEPSWAALGPSWAVLAQFWAALGPSWTALGPSWAAPGLLGRLLGRLGPPWAWQEKPKRRQDKVGGYPHPSKTTCEKTR